MIEAILPFMRRVVEEPAYPDYSGQTFGVAIIASQSNDVKYDYSPGGTEPAAPIVPTTAGVKLNDGNTALEAIDWDFGYSNQMSLTFNEYTGGKLAILNAAVSGSNVYGADGAAHWGLNGTLLAPAKTRLAALASLLGGNDKIRYIIMGSKEAGAFGIGDNVATKQQWMDAIVSIANDLAATYPQAEFLLPGIGIRKDWDNTRLNNSFGAIRTAQSVDLPALNPKFRYVQTDTYLKSEGYYDYIHWGQNIHNGVGLQLGAAMVEGLTLPITPDSTAPFIKTAIVYNATRIDLTFNEACTLTSTGSFTVKVNGAVVTVTSMGIANAERCVLNLGSSILAGDTVTVSYNATTGNVADLSGNALPGITDHPVANNIS